MGEIVKIQVRDPNLGWIFQTRCPARFPYPWYMLAGYRRDYPREEYRLVFVAPDGSVTAIPDDLEALENCRVSHEIDEGVDNA